MNRYTYGTHGNIEFSDKGKDSTEASQTGKGVRHAFAPLPDDDPGRHKSLLLLKFLLNTIFWVAILSLAYFQGLVDLVFAKNPNVSWFGTLLTPDVQTTYITVMVGVFAYGLYESVGKVVFISRELDEVKKPSPSIETRVGEYLLRIHGQDSVSRATLASTLWAKWFNRTSSLKFVSSTLLLLGLLGTVIGFTIALGGVNDGTMENIDSLKTMVSMLVKGMGVALYTTIVGTLLGGLWLSMNSLLIESGLVNLLTAIIERGEAEAEKSGPSSKKEGE